MREEVKLRVSVDRASIFDLQVFSWSSVNYTERDCVAKQREECNVEKDSTK